MSVSSVVGKCNSSFASQTDESYLKSYIFHLRLQFPYLLEAWIKYSNTHLILWAAEEATLNFLLGKLNTSFGTISTNNHNNNC